MCDMIIKLRRGTSAERHLITPAEGELIYTTDTKALYVGDGSSAGGNIVGRDFRMSLIKSAIRIVAGVALCTKLVVAAGVLLIVAELFDIMEEGV